MKCEACGHINKPKGKLSPTSFDLFWQAYPRKVGKLLAQKVWLKIKGDDELVSKIMQAVQIQKKSDAWQKDQGLYIPHASTWLHQQRWDDEVTIGGVIKKQEPTLFEKQQTQVQKKETEDLLEREYARQVAIREAAKRDQARTNRMQDAWGDN